MVKKERHTYAYASPGVGIRASAFAVGIDVQPAWALGLSETLNEP